MNYRKKTYRSAAAITVAAMILGGCAAREEYTGGHVTEEAPQISAEQAKLHAETEYEKYRIIQDRLYESDFDRFLMLEQEVNHKDEV